MKNHCVSVTLAKQLKELGVKQNAYWSWYENGDSAELIHNPEGYRSMEEKTFDAFLATELGEMLPCELYTKDDYFALDINKMSINNKDKNRWGIVYANSQFYKTVDGKRVIGHGETLHSEIADSLPDALAKMLIYLIKEGLVKVEEL